MRNCSRCKIAKDIGAFPSYNGKRYYHCSPCAKEFYAEYYAKNKVRMAVTQRARRLKSLFNISVEDYEAMYKAQNGCCAICLKINTSGKRLYVDHNHATKEVRGLLCHMCNTGLGNFDDTRENLQSAINYLTRADEKSRRGNIEVKGAI